MRKKRETKYVTIKDVAEKAGVSIATVSRVINNGRVKSERKRKVLDAINELNYMPNNSARNLASVNATKRVSCVTPSLEPFYIPFIEGFKSGLSLYKYEGVIESFNNDMQLFDEICDKQEANAEVRGIVQFAPKKELINKNVISMLEVNNELKYEVDKNFLNKKIGLYFADETIYEFFNNVVFQNMSTKKVTEQNIDEFDIIITNYVDSAFALLNKNYKGIIKTIETATNVNVKYNNVKTLQLDMYGLGVYVSRTVIKEFTDEKKQKQEIKIIVQ